MGRQSKAVKKDSFYAQYGIVEKIIREPMPLGGFGFRCAVYHNGIELKNGVTGIAGVLQQAREASANPLQ